ncbi:MAG: hypothetical protein KAR42_16355 [candidate division Zixibacteria bacterium]|nr:hypothetical protein [candidate division Zixibacteria bacterium]
MEKKILLCIAIIVIAVLSFGCGGDLTGGSDNNDVYVINASLVKNTFTDSARIDVVLTKNGDTCHCADIQLGAIVLDTNAIGYYKIFDSSQIIVDTVYTLNVRDSSSLNANLTIRLANTVTITDAGFRFYTGSAEAVSWTGGTNADGFILASTPPAGAVVDTGYTSYYSILNGVIPVETFLINPTTRIIGIHKIYVAAYNGAPVANSLLPFDLPKINIPASNVNGSNISGRVAGIVISASDSIDVSAP